MRSSERSSLLFAVFASLAVLMAISDGAFAQQQPPSAASAQSQASDMAPDHHLVLGLMVCGPRRSAQETSSQPANAPPEAAPAPEGALDASGRQLPDEPQPCFDQNTQASAGEANSPQDQSQKNGTQPGQQPKRILGVMPNFRAVSAGTLPPPPTAKQSFIIATQNSFDYSSFIFVGITSLLAEGTDAHPDLGKGVAGFGRYYWRGFLDKTDGNYLVIFALPTILHEDERYYAKGTGPIWKRGIYAATRIFITPNYHGQNTINASELLGRAMAQGISTTYYPSADRTAGALADKYAFALGRDALTNVFREFWPDIAKHVLHRHP